LSKRGTFIASLALAVALAAVGAAAAMTRATQAPASPASAKASSLTGAGSSFVFPLVSQWIPAVNSAYGIKITYGAIGSSGGIAAIQGGTVDFGASDAPMTPSQFQACKGCIQIPWALGGTSFPYNVPGATKRIRLTGPVLAGIFSGQIKKWNAAAITALNPGANLPDLAIVPIHRSDGSGTTYNVTDYLSSASPAWRTSMGKGTTVGWPTGTGAKGSSGVAAALSHTKGGIAYVDVAYSLVNHFTFASIKNRAGKFTTPGIRSCAAAGSTIVRVAPRNNGISIVNPGKRFKTAYPVCTFTYVIVHDTSSKAPELRTFIHWALTKGQAFGPKLLFVPIPKVILVASLKALAQVKSS
jgi:phosphate transport system substrate-binding protein